MEGEWNIHSGEGAREGQSSISSGSADEEVKSLSSAVRLEHLVREFERLSDALRPLESVALRERSAVEQAEIERLSKARNLCSEEMLLLRAHALEETRRSDRPEPPPAISGPSSASADEVETRREMVSFLDRRVFLEACVAMHRGAGQDALGSELVAAVRIVHGYDQERKPYQHARGGLFGRQFPVKRSETLFTSVLASKLAKVLPSVLGGRFPVHCIHQVPDRGGGMIDIGVYAELDEQTWAPLCLFECGLKCESHDKATQTMAYAVNVSAELQPEQVCLAAEVILWPCDMRNLSPHDIGWLRLSAFRLRKGLKIAIAPLWDGALNAHSMGRLLACIHLVAHANFAALPRPWHRMKNVSMDEHHVWKAYDYRERLHVEADDRRSPEWSLQFIPGCELVCGALGQDFALIRYARVTGTHQPRSVAQLIAVIRALQALHSKGIVHGDVRASNIVFDEDGTKATLIDFDFAGRAGEKRYPSGFRTIEDDGGRHREARPRAVLQFAHDWFAVGAMMKKCRLQEEKASEFWSSAVDNLCKVAHVSATQVEQVVALLELQGGSHQLLRLWPTWRDRQPTEGGWKKVQAYKGHEREQSQKGKAKVRCD